MWGDKGHFETVVREATCPFKISLLQWCDRARFERLVQEQINLVGGKTVFNKIHKALTEGRFWSDFDPYFVKEQCDLYSYRHKFIVDNAMQCDVTDLQGVYFFLIKTLLWKYRVFKNKL